MGKKGERGLDATGWQCNRQGCDAHVVWAREFCNYHAGEADSVNYRRSKLCSGHGVPEPRCDSLAHPDEAVDKPDPRQPGRKDDAGKPRWDLLPMRALDQVSAVLAYGANKYGEENWRGVPEARKRYLAAALRHLAAWRLGQADDPESGLPHLAHAACCVLFLLEVP